MKIEELPKSIQEEIHGLKHGSISTEDAIQEALEESTDIFEFPALVAEKLTTLSEELIKYQAYWDQMLCDAGA